MENKAEYYLYLESYVFLFKKENKGLIYDSFAKKSYLFDIEGKLENLISNLLDITNMYVVTVTQEMLDDIFVKKFIKLIRNFYIGDIIPISKTSIKPILFPPLLDFQGNKPDGLKKKGNDILKNLSELTIYLNSFCENKKCSQKCSLFSRQCLFCKKEEHYNSLNYEQLKNFLKDLPTLNFPIHIIGGSLSLYSNWSDLISFLTNYNFVYYWIHYTEFLSKKEIYKNLKCKILIDYPIIENELDEVLEFAKESKSNISFRFLIRDLDTYKKTFPYQEKYPSLEMDILPIYDENDTFLYENVFLTNSDLEDFNLSKKEIFSHQILNTNHFGKLLIDSTGLIYTNLNENPIGHISSYSLKSALLKIFNLKTCSWFKIRDMRPCNQCLYQWLCPSPSNYDYVMRKSNLCQMKFEKHE